MNLIANAFTEERSLSSWRRVKEKDPRPGGCWNRAPEILHPRCVCCAASLWIKGYWKGESPLMPVSICFPVAYLILARAVGFGFDGDAYSRENIGNICFSVCKWQNNFSVERDSVTWSARRALVINSSVRRNRMDLIKCALGWLLYMLSLLLLGERGLPLNCIVEYNSFFITIASV